MPPTATASTNPPTPAKPGRTSASKTRSRSARFASIRRIPISSTSPRSAIVWGPNEQRGVYRTTDGGKTWKQVYTRGPKAGAVGSDSRPRTIPTSSTPPSGRCIARPGISKAAAPAADSSNPPTAATPGPISAAIPACPKASSDASASPFRRRTPIASGRWSKPKTAASSAPTTAARPGRASTRTASCASAPGITRASSPIRKNADTVYDVNTGFFRSDDGGKTFAAIRTPHGDNHDLWIAPNDPNRMIESNDGGANVSFNGGRTWSTHDEQPTAQFYRVALDNDFPYHAYGAQQDNTTVRIVNSQRRRQHRRARLVRRRRRRKRLDRARSARIPKSSTPAPTTACSRATTTAPANCATSPSGPTIPWAPAPKP